MAEINYRIEMQGLTENIIALERFAPELKRELNKEIRGVLAPIVLEAKGYLPSNDQIHPSGWAKGGFKRFNGIKWHFINIKLDLVKKSGLILWDLRSNTYTLQRVFYHF